MPVDGEIQRRDDKPVSGAEKRRVSKAVEDYLADCEDRQGKSGYGLAVRTPETYEYRHGFLIEFKPEAYTDEVNAEFIKGFRHFLRNHKKDLSDRACYNIMQAVSKFLIKNGCGRSEANSQGRCLIRRPKSYRMKTQTCRSSSKHATKKKS